MEKYYNILLATDYSEAVKSAEHYAVQFAKSTNSRLTFLHVYEFPLSATPVKVMDYIKTAEEWRKSELKRLEQHCESLFNILKIRTDEVNYECIVREGNLGKQIRKEAKESEIDFIMVGTHGASGFRKVFFGSHAWDVIKKSKVPVIAIPLDAFYTGIKNIVFATEYREGEIPAINYLTQIARRFKAEVTVLHVTNYVLSKQFETELFGKFKKEVVEKIHYEKLNIRLLKNDVISDGLEKYCRKNNVDWLVMSPEKPFLLEKIFLPKDSFTRKMTFHTHVPLLAIPDFYNNENMDFWKNFAQEELVNEVF